MQGNWRTKASEPHVIRAIGDTRPCAGAVELGTVTVTKRRPKGKPTKNRWTNAQKRARSAREAG